MASTRRKQFHRRELLKLTAAAGGVVGLGVPLLAAPPDAEASRLREEGRGRVVGVGHAGAMKTKSKADEAIVERMTGEAMKLLTGKPTIAAAWRDVVSPSDVVGVKVNCLGGPGMSTSPAVVAAITRGLQAAGVPNERIIVYDMYEDHITRRGTGFELNEDPAKGPLVRHQGSRSLHVDTGYLGYQKTPSKHESGASRFANMLAHCTAIVNAPVIKDHALAGVTVAMKNMTHGSIHNPDDYHSRDCNPAIAHIYDHPAIRDKVRVIVCDGLRIQYDGGPQDSPRSRVVHDHVYASTDPVAMDSYALKLIEDLRKQHGRTPLAKRHPKGTYLAAAEKLGLGVHDPARLKVEITKIG